MWYFVVKGERKKNRVISKWGADIILDQLIKSVQDYASILNRAHAPKG